MKFGKGKMPVVMLIPTAKFHSDLFKTATALKDKKHPWAEVSLEEYRLTVKTDGEQRKDATLPDLLKYVSTALGKKKLPVSAAADQENNRVILSPEGEVEAESDGK